MNIHQAPATKHVMLLVFGVALVAIALGAAFRVWWGAPQIENSQVSSGSKANERALPPISVPAAWKDVSGQVQVPEGVKQPADAVQQVEQVRGYERASSVRAFRGDDGQWYWEVRTPGGVMTVKAGSTSTPPSQ